MYLSAIMRRYVDNVLNVALIVSEKIFTNISKYLIHTDSIYT